MNFIEFKRNILLIMLVFYIVPFLLSVYLSEIIGVNRNESIGLNKSSTSIAVLAELKQPSSSGIIAKNPPIDTAIQPEGRTFFGLLSIPCK